MKTQKKQPKIGKAKIYIHASFNNTIVSISDTAGNILANSSAGEADFKGSRKSTPYAATVTTNKLLDKVKNHGISEVDVFISGVGNGRDTALRAVAGAGFTINSIKDRTPIAFNGPRPKKPRRV